MSPPTRAFPLAKIPPAGGRMTALDLATREELCALAEPRLRAHRVPQGGANMTAWTFRGPRPGRQVASLLGPVIAAHRAAARAQGLLPGSGWLAVIRYAQGGWMGAHDHASRRVLSGSLVLRDCEAGGVLELLYGDGGWRSAGARLGEPFWYGPKVRHRVTRVEAGERWVLLL